MTSARPISSELTCVLPTQILALGEALAPVVRAARRELSRRVRPTDQTFSTLDDLAHHMGVVEHALTQLTPRLDGLMTDVIRNDAAGLLEAGRSAGRFEQVLSELVEGYLAVKASHAGPQDAEARVLMIGVYRHHIRNICDWLDNLISAIANPAREMQLRGIKPSDHVQLVISLNMTTPPEMDKLAARVKRFLHQPKRSQVLTIPPQRSNPHAPGFLATIRALVFGVGVSKAILRKKQD
jgi:uncharacterized protein Smg (DUF494 family)